MILEVCVIEPTIEEMRGATYTNEHYEKLVAYYKKMEQDWPDIYIRGDSGIDLLSIGDNVIEQYGTLNFHIRCRAYNKHLKINEKKDYSAYRLIPRSSISKTPLMMHNSEGIIDRGYRGPIMGKVVNLDYLFNRYEYTVKSGTRLFQIVAADLDPIRVKVIADISETETDRGAGGFGSTG